MHTVNIRHDVYQPYSFSTVILFRYERNNDWCKNMVQIFIDKYYVSHSDYVEF